jgi:adenine-specific DNA methylase
MYGTATAHPENVCIDAVRERLTQSVCGSPYAGDMLTTPRLIDDPASVRKARGAFFTPEGITDHLADWALRTASDSVLEPSTGEAAFLLAAVRRLQSLGAVEPIVHGVEIHAHSAAVAAAHIEQHGGRPNIRVSDFFLTDPQPVHDAVIGNPPFIRYQDFAGAARDRARFAAQQQGVALTGLASSWASFVVHSAAFLKPGGRLAMVLPAELLSVNYASPVRRFLLERFESVELITFEEQVFPDAEADTVLVKADGWGGPPAGYARLRQTRNASTLDSLESGSTWTPTDAGDRWAPLPFLEGTHAAIASAPFVTLATFGDTSLGAVTGSNHFFAMPPQRAEALGIPRRDLVRISPPGSSHLRGLALTASAMTRLGQAGASTRLLYPSSRPANATLDYIRSGEETGVSAAYKCRVRAPWWRVPILQAPDLFLTYMNADTPRLTTNQSGARHLNSVHGVYLKPEVRELARDVLPIASLNSLTLLSAEITGRSYGGGILKIEPREADRWLMPTLDMLVTHRAALTALKPRVQRLLQARNLLSAAELVDEALGLAKQMDVAAVRADRDALHNRRVARGRSGGRN